MAAAVAPARAPFSLHAYLEPPSSDLDVPTEAPDLDAEAGSEFLLSEASLARFSSQELFGSQDSVASGTRARAPPLAADRSNAHLASVVLERGDPLAKLFDPYSVPVPHPGRSPMIDAARYWATTDATGKLLIERGFPLIGTGSSSLCFLVDDARVAKVPVFAEEIDKDEYDRHIMERERDLHHALYYPDAFAGGSFVEVMIRAPGPVMNAEEEQALFRRYLNAYRAETRERPVFGVDHAGLYVQERLFPRFRHHGLFPEDLTRDCPNRDALQQLLREQPDVKQFGKTRDGRWKGFDYN